MPSDRPQTSVVPVKTFHRLPLCLSRSQLTPFPVGVHAAFPHHIAALVLGGLVRVGRRQERVHATADRWQVGSDGRWRCLHLFVLIVTAGVNMVHTVSGKDSKSDRRRRMSRGI